ncbi:MAG: queuosine precursor transporter [Bacteroidota bacterium]
MKHPVLSSKSSVLFILLGGFFITNALVAEFIGVKIFALEDTLGLQPFNWNLFGQKGSLMFTAGVLLWPIVFVMTDVINEYFGKRGVQVLSYMTVGLISYAFIMVYLAISLSPADFWVGVNQQFGVPDMQLAFANIFGQSNWIIVGSLIAFLVGQVLDAIVFHRVRRFTGEGRIWLRATISTIFSQFIDSFVVLYIAFVLGPQQWEMSLFFAVGTVNYAYKVGMAILLIPLLYIAHYVIDGFLGEAEAERLKEAAALGS